MKIGRFFAVAALFLFLPVPALSLTIEGKIVAVRDGDTIILLDHNRQVHRVRLAQIDAPELGRRHRPGQPHAHESKQSLAELVFGKDVRAECDDTDRYWRKVCRVYSDGQDVNLEQVRRGMAWVYRKYAIDRAYFEAEEKAKASRLGLWKDKDVVEPWEWRKQHRRFHHENRGEKPLLEEGFSSAEEPVKIRRACAASRDELGEITCRCRI